MVWPKAQISIRHINTVQSPTILGHAGPSANQKNHVFCVACSFCTHLYRAINHGCGLKWQPEAKIWSTKLTQFKIKRRGNIRLPTYTTQKNANGKLTLLYQWAFRALCDITKGVISWVHILGHILKCGEGKKSKGWPFTFFQCSLTGERDKQ